MIRDDQRAEMAARTWVRATTMDFDRVIEQAGSAAMIPEAVSEVNKEAECVPSQGERKVCLAIGESMNIRMTAKSICGAWQRPHALLAAVVVLLLAIPGCGGGTEPTAAPAGASRPAEMTEVTLASSAIAGVANVHLAQEDGLFEGENLSVKSDFIKFTPDIVAAVVGGSDEFGHINTSTLLQAVEANVPIQVVSPGYSGEAAESGIYVVPGGDIKSLKDLEGRRIGVAGLKNIQQIAIMATADKAGVDPSDLQFVEVSVPTMVAAVERGQVDAVALPEPFVTLAGDQLVEVVDNIYEPFGPSPILTYFITSKRYAAERPDVVKAFGTAMVKAQELAQQNPARVRGAVASYTEITPDVAAKMALPGWTTNLQMESLKRQAEFMVKFGILTKAPTDLNALFAAAEGQQ